MPAMNSHSLDCTGKVIYIVEKYSIANLQRKTNNKVWNGKSVTRGEMARK